MKKIIIFVCMLIPVSAQAQFNPPSQMQIMQRQQAQYYQQQQIAIQQAQLRAQQEQNRIMQRQLDEQRQERSQQIRTNAWHQWGY